MPARRKASAILAEWQAVQWQLLRMQPLDMVEARALEAKSDFLRAEYEDLLERACECGGPQLPRFPDDAGPPRDD